MKINIQDLLNTEIGAFLPAEFKNLEEGNYISFFYWYDDTTSRITDIKNIAIVPRILMSIYKNNPFNKDGVYYSLGYFESTFDTQNTLFYRLLDYYYGKTSEAHKKKLIDFFLQAKKTDLENVNRKLQETTFNNIFNIYGRDNYIDALNRFLYIPEYVMTPVIAIADNLDYYHKTKTGKSFYGDGVSKILMAVRNPNGGLIPDSINKLRYFYVGEKSSLLSADPQLQEAKDLYRNKLSISDIYAKTGWYFNRFDFKWRKPILDADVTIPNYDSPNVYIKSGSRFNNNDEPTKLYNILKLVPTKDAGGLATKMMEIYLKVGWDTYLSDILKHPTLYKHYPKLFNLPVFFATTDSNKLYSFYYNPELNYIMIFGNPKLFDLKTVLLHEVQHAIQRIEGFGTGGNQFLAKMIQAIGGENIKKYFYVLKNIIDIYTRNAKSGGLYSAEKYNVILKDCIDKYDQMAVALMYQPDNDKAYYENTKMVVDGLMELHLNANMMVMLKKLDVAKLDSLNKYLGDAMLKQLDTVFGYMKDAGVIANRMLGQGYTEQQVSKIFFNTYEALLGEVESREVQKSSKSEVELAGYLLPMTSESIDDDKVSVIFDDFEVDGIPTNKPDGAIERSDDGKYTIHLFESTTPEPLLHELGHIIADLIGRPAINDSIAVGIDENTIKELGGVEEVFCELFLCYLVKQNFSEDLNYDITADRKLMDKNIEIVNTALDKIFFPKENKEEDIQFLNMLVFVKKLNDLTDAVPPAPEQKKSKAEQSKEQKEESAESDEAGEPEKNSQGIWYTANQLRNYLKEYYGVVPQADGGFTYGGRFYSNLKELAVDIGFEYMPDKDKWFVEEIKTKTPKPEDGLNTVLIRVVPIRNKKVYIYSVNRNYVNLKHYPDFTMGGHHFVSKDYEFIPKNEIWIDQDLDEVGREATIKHELTEFELMVYEKMSYEEAHKIALKTEVPILKKGVKGASSPAETKPETSGASTDKKKEKALTQIAELEVVLATGREGNKFVSKQYYEDVLWAVNKLRAKNGLPPTEVVRKKATPSDKPKATKDSPEHIEKLIKKASKISISDLLKQFGIDDRDTIYKTAKRSTVFDTQRSAMTDNKELGKRLRTLWVFTQIYRKLKTSTKNEYIRDYMDEDDMASHNGEREYSMTSYNNYTVIIKEGKNKIGELSGGEYTSFMINNDKQGNRYEPYYSTLKLIREKMESKK